MTVRVEKGFVRVDRQNLAGPLGSLRWPDDETEVEAERTGMARHLDALGMSVVLDDDAAVAGHTDGAAGLWTARDGQIIEWRRPSEALQARAESYAGRQAHARAETHQVPPTGDGNPTATGQR